MICVISTYDTLENNFGIKHRFAKYLNGFFVVGWVLIDISPSDISSEIVKIFKIIVFYQRMVMVDKQEIEKHVLEYIGINWLN